MGLSMGAVVNMGPTRAKRPDRRSHHYWGRLAMILQAVGYWAIRQYQALSKHAASQSEDRKPNAKEELERKRILMLKVHIACMLWVFAIVCTSPAIVRMSESGGLPVFLVGVGFLLVIWFLYYRSFFRRVEKLNDYVTFSVAGMAYC